MPQALIENLAADFAGFQRVMERMVQGEVESFQGLSGQFGLYEDVDALLKRMEATAVRAASSLANAGANGPADASRQLGLLDSMLEQLDRYAIVADLRGATATSGDLLKKIQQWVAVLRQWLVGLERQLRALP